MRYEVKFNNQVSNVVLYFCVCWCLRCDKYLNIACHDEQKHPEFTSPDLIRNPLLFSFVKSIFNNNALEIDTHSSVTSLPGAPAQHWHHDTGHLFDDDVSGLVIISIRVVHLRLVLSTPNCGLCFLFCCGGAEDLARSCSTNAPSRSDSCFRVHRLCRCTQHDWFFAFQV